MANAKITFKAPLTGLGDLQWVNIKGKGKKKYDPENKLDGEDPTSYIYTASVRITKAQADEMNEKIKAFWKDNKPQGATKMQYDLVKPELEPVMVDGKPKLDEDDAPVMKETGMYIIQAKTNAAWDDGKPNVIKTLRGNGEPVDLKEKLIGEGSTGVLHGTLMINSFKGNEGVNFYLTAVQLKKFVEYSGSEVEADDLGEDEGLEDDGMGGMTGPEV